MNERLASLGRDFDTNLFSKVGVARDDELLLFYANLISNLPVTFLPPRDNFESLLFQGNIFPPLKFIAAGEFFLSLIVKRGFVLIPLFPFFSKGMRVSRTRLKGKGSSFDRCLQFSREGRILSRRIFVFGERSYAFGRKKNSERILTQLLKSLG